MNWNDSAYLLSKNKYNENSIIAEIFTENHGKFSGIIFGASSKKIKNYLEIGNKLHINYNHKNDGRIGYFKIEILNAITPLYFDNRKKLLCITSAMNLIKIVTVEAQSNSNIYYLINNFFNILSSENWTTKYIFWELELLKLVGFDLELKKIVNEEIINNEKKYFVQNNFEKKIVPNFLVEVNDKKIDKTNLIKGLKLVGDYLDKNILKPNNINYPSSRLDFINVLK
jgi:DNA repair protein RecO (recombination protein O)